MKQQGGSIGFELLLPQLHLIFQQRLDKAAVLPANANEVLKIVEWLAGKVK